MNKLSFFLGMGILAFASALPLQADEDGVKVNKEYQWSLANYHRYDSLSKAVNVPDKAAFIEKYRWHLHQSNPQFSVIESKYTLAQLRGLLLSEGKFADLDDRNFGPSAAGGNQANSGGIITEAFYRFWFLANAFCTGQLSFDTDKELWTALQKAILHYGALEISRKNIWSRFHASCFAIPRGAVYTYFALLPQMEAAESGKADDPLLVKTCDMLKTVALQTWTQPVRDDATDLNVVQVERFRKHVWWVGGNGIGTTGYRSVFPVAFMYRSIPMLDVLHEVCQKSISNTSQVTYDEAFWTEGFTADGAGWGHGAQCLVWGYPIHGTSGALDMLGTLKDSPWKARLTRDNAEALMNYFRGGNYYYYKGYTPPCLDRSSMLYAPEKRHIPYAGLLRQTLKDWQEAFTPDELKELKQLQEEVQQDMLSMEGYEAYNGTRWFFNNDDLVKKNNNYYIMVNMASNRCDGLESATGFADEYNFCSTDGATYFEKTGNEYRSIIAGMDMTAYPGVTAREGMERLTPVTNWRGYCSKHNFAAAATAGGENAVAGYIFEKIDGSDKNNVNDKGNGNGKNEVLYGVKAHKSYFMIGDYMVALGAGITNLQPEQPGSIRTTIEQTAHTDSVYTYKKGGVQWVIQENRFAYAAMPEYQKHTHYVCESKPAQWVKVNRSNASKKNLPETADIFRMWIDHGQTPVNDKYGYVVYAGKGKPAAQVPFKVLVNDTLMQAVESKDGKVIEAVFYTADKVLKTKKHKLSASAPCTILMEQTKKGTRLTVTDALMDKNLKTIIVTLDDKQVECDMPQKELTGKPVTISF